MRVRAAGPASTSPAPVAPVALISNSTMMVMKAANSTVATTVNSTVAKKANPTVATTAETTVAATAEVTAATKFAKNVAPNYVTCVIIVTVTVTLT